MSFKSLKVSIEEGVVEAGPALDPQESAVADADLVTDTVEATEETAAMDDAQATVEEISESMDEVQDITENVIEPADQGEGLSEGEAASVEALFRSVNRRCGLRSSRRSSTMPAKEQFGNKATRRQATRIAKESAWDKIKELWERFKTWLLQIWEKTKGWFGTISNSAGGIAEAFKKLKESLEKDRGTAYKKAEYREAKELDKIVIGKDERELEEKDIENYLTTGLDIAAMKSFLVRVETAMKTMLVSSDSANKGAITASARAGKELDAELISIMANGTALGFEIHDGETNIRKLCRDYRVNSDTIKDASKDVHGFGILAGGKVLVIERHNGDDSTRTYQTATMHSADENEGKRTFKNYSVPGLSKLCDVGYVQAKKMENVDSQFSAIADSMKAAVAAAEAALKTREAEVDSSQNASAMSVFSIIKSRLKFQNDLLGQLVKLACSGNLTMLTHTRALIANAWHKMEK